MKTTQKRITNRIALLVVLVPMFLAWSCDPFEEDIVPDETKTTVGESDFFTTPNASTLIDLKSTIKSYSNVTLTITNQPVHGNLEKIRDAVFSYTPEEEFTGKDYFIFNVQSNGKSVLKDSIIIHVGKDTTEFPCSLYAIYDSAVIPFSTGPRWISIPVLANDRICGVDLNDLGVRIFSGASHGTAYVDPSSDSSRVVYIPTTGYFGHDEFIYKVFDRTDTTVYSLAMVSVWTDPGTCHTVLRDDYKLGETGRSHWVNVLRNDSICARDSVNDVLTISVNPRTGTAAVTAFGVIQYTADPFFGYSADSLTYRYCQGDICQTAKLRISFIGGGSCEVKAKNDYANLPLNGASLQAFVNVMANDSLCSGLQFIEVVGDPKNGTAFGTDGMVFYTANSSTSPSDSLRYRICDQGNRCAEAKVYINRQ